MLRPLGYGTRDPRCGKYGPAIEEKAQPFFDPRDVALNLILELTPDLRGSS